MKKIENPDPRICANPTCAKPFDPKTSRGSTCSPTCYRDWQTFKRREKATLKRAPKGDPGFYVPNCNPITGYKY